MSRLEFQVVPADNERLARLCGQFDEHLKQIEHRLDVQVSNRGDLFSIEGEAESSNSAKALIEHLYEMTENETLAPEEVHLSLQESGLVGFFRVDFSMASSASCSCSRVS